MVWTYALFGSGILCAALWVIGFLKGWSHLFWLFMGAFVGIVGGFASYEEHQKNSFERLSVEEACVEDNARDVPAPASLETAKDDRVGPIYPCHYMIDHGISAGVDGHLEPTPMRLQRGVTEQLFSDQHFTAEGDINGTLLLGIGSIDGDYQAEQTVERTQVVAFMAETAYGFTSFVVETGSVRYEVCSETCEPTVSIWVSEEPLFTKRNDENRELSIWHPRERQSQLDPLTRDGQPASPGQTVQALASRIVVTVPQDMLPAGS